MLHRCIEGEKIGVDGSKIVDVDRRPDRCPEGTPPPPPPTLFRRAPAAMVGAQHATELTPPRCIDSSGQIRPFLPRTLAPNPSLCG